MILGLDQHSSGPVIRGHPAYVLGGSGRLEAILHNASTAARVGTTVLRYGLQSPAGVGPSNLVLLSGPSTAAEVSQRLTGLLLTGLSSLHAEANPVTGEFSLNAESF